MNGGTKNRCLTTWRHLPAEGADNYAIRDVNATGPHALFLPQIQARIPAPAKAPQKTPLWRAGTALRPSTKAAIGPACWSIAQPR